MIDINVVREQRRASSPRNGHDRAVEHPSWSDTICTAATVDSSSRVEIAHGVKGEQFDASQHPTQLSLSTIVARARDHLHQDRLGDGHGRTTGFDQLLETAIG